MCSCKDAKGKGKNLYVTQSLAQQQVDYIRQNRDKKLAIYKCPEENGWHLTSNLHPY